MPKWQLIEIQLYLKNNNKNNNEPLLFRKIRQFIYISLRKIWEEVQ